MNDFSQCVYVPRCGQACEKFDIFVGETSDIIEGKPMSYLSEHCTGKITCFKYIKLTLFWISMVMVVHYFPMLFTSFLLVFNYLFTSIHACFSIYLFYLYNQ